MSIHTKHCLHRYIVVNNTLVTNKTVILRIDGTFVKETVQTKVR